MNAFRLVAILTACSALVTAKTRSDIPLAPVPAKIAAARKIFITNGGDDLAYDAAYAAFKRWARYTLVDTPEAADLTIEIRLVLTDLPTRHTAHVNGRELPDPPLMLIISDPASREQLWSNLERRRRAITQKNRDKETIDTAERLVASLRARLEAH
jgi:hypothetical protein